ncbi:hypothetical protein B0H14DRAFT_3566767 [Mycena olivaceomarginata]|nr:hypothetical protein B0H14DRAFT_3566767 [Mycena olivaceomarginata]
MRLTSLARRTPSPNEENALYQGGGDRYGDLGHGLPSGLPSFRHEPQYQYHGNMDSNVGRVANQTTAFNSRVAVLKHQIPGPALMPPQRVPSSIPPPDVDYQGLVAQLGAMALKQDEMQAQLHAQNELQTQNEYLRQRMHELERIVAQGALRLPLPSRSASTASLGAERWLSVARPECRGTARSARISNTPPEETFDLTTPSKSLPTRELQRARDVLQFFHNSREVSRVWREVVGVPSTVWPDLTVQRFNDVTHEAYLNPLLNKYLTNYKMAKNLASRAVRS